jgi:hypothetical protein
MERRVRVLGLDWSTTSMSHFRGETIVTDLRKKWPVSDRFDGAICCEVLEHLTPGDAQLVLANMDECTRDGFVITVPARECMEAHVAPCQHCGQVFHVWGHLQKFLTFGEVDRLVGRAATERLFIPCLYPRENHFCRHWMRVLGVYPHDPSYLCPSCGAALEPPRRRSLLKRGLVKALRLLEPVLAKLGPQHGWFSAYYRKT